jgi:hypothetical protein
LPFFTFGLRERDLQHHSRPAIRRRRFDLKTSRRDELGVCVFCRDSHL